MITELIGRGLAYLSGAERPEKWLVDWVRGGVETASGEHISEETALTCAAVKAAVSVLAETVASLPIDVYQETKSGQKLPAPEHPVAQLLSREPSPDMSAYIWKETKQGHLATWGNGYSEIVRGVGSNIAALRLRQPQPFVTKPVRLQSGGIGYECRDGHGVMEATIPAANMLHIPGFGFDGLIGRSPIGFLRSDRRKQGG